MARTQLNRVGAALADPSRAEIVTALMDGRAYTCSELARHSGVAVSTASGHLSKLLDAGLVTVHPQGRHRYFRIGGSDIAEMLERLGASPTPPSPANQPAAGLAYARACYDHFAGTAAVKLYQRLVGLGHIREVEEPLVKVTASGRSLFEELNVDMTSPRGSRRPLARSCLDWTERRHHLAGLAGARFLEMMERQGWVVRGTRPRLLKVTATGKEALNSLG